MTICKKCRTERPSKTRCKVCKKECDFKWRIKNYRKFKASQSKYYKKRCKEDILFKLRGVLRSRLNAVLRQRNLPKRGSTVKYLGCSLMELRERLGGMFKPGMSWKNHGDWHIDHIVPLATAKSEKDLYRLYSYKNLQPLWAEENLAKSNSI